MDIYEKIRAGEYQSKIGWMPKPVEPAILRKQAKELTLEQLSSIPEVQAKYQHDLAEQRKITEARTIDQRRLDAQFWLDLCEYAGVPSDHPFIMKLEGIAWDRRHSGGLNDVALLFEELLPLWEEAQQMVKN